MSSFSSSSSPSHRPLESELASKPESKPKANPKLKPKPEPRRTLRCHSHSYSHPSRSLSVYILTHNCARRPVNTSHLAEHLFRGLGSSLGSSSTSTSTSSSSSSSEDNDADDADDLEGNGNLLPDVIFISLQELAPLGPAFLGGWYWLGEEYLRNVVDAVGLAARKRLRRERGERRMRQYVGNCNGDDYGNTNHNGNDNNGSEEDGGGDNVNPYELVIVRNVGMVGAMGFVKRERMSTTTATTTTATKKNIIRITDLWEAGVGCGVYGRVGNKGAVAVKVGLDVDVDVDVLGEGKSKGVGGKKRKRSNHHTQLCFVSAHLAPHEYAVERRNRDWEEIVRGLVFTRVATTSTKDEGSVGRGSEGLTTRTSWLGFPLTMMEEEEEAEEEGDDNGDDNCRDGVGSGYVDEDGDINDTTPLLSSSSLSSLSQSRRNKRKRVDKDQNRFHEPNKINNPESAHDTRTATTSTSTSIIKKRKKKKKETLGMHHGIYSPQTHLIVAGDLNYRTAMTRPRSSPKSPTQLSARSLLTNDQLTQQRRAGKTMHGLDEAEIRFGPTYKLSQEKDDVVRVDWELGDNDDDSNDSSTKKNANMSKSNRGTNSDYQDGSSSSETDSPPISRIFHYTGTRSPSWCDRILFSGGIRARHGSAYVALPPSYEQTFSTATSSNPQDASKKEEEKEEEVILSDHLPVCLAASINFDLDLDLDLDHDHEVNDVNNSFSSKLSQPFPLRHNWRARRIRARLCEILTGLVVVVIQQAMLMLKVMVPGRLKSGWAVTLLLLLLLSTATCLIFGVLSFRGVLM